MDRRTFFAGSAVLAATLALPRISGAAHARLAALQDTGDERTLELSLTDTGFEIAPSLAAGRYAMTVTNAGTSPDSHFAFGKIPDHITDAQFEAFLQAADGTEVFGFEDLAYVGAPDWPAPGSSVSGVVDLAPGRYLLFDPFGGRQPATLLVEGNLAVSADPKSDLSVALHEMAIDLPETTFTSDPMRWKVTNSGGLAHDFAVVPVAPEMTEAQFGQILAMMMNPEADAAPPADLPDFVYLPVAAVSILAPQHTSWIDIQLDPGRYLVICMLPFGTGHPHALDGMYRFIEVR